MEFQNAAKGIKKIYQGEIILLIAVLLLGVGGLFIQDASAAPAMALVLIACASVLMIVGLIFNLLGLIKARTDDQCFLFALYNTLGAIAVAILKPIFQDNTTIYRILDAISTVCEIMISYNVLTGIINLAGKLRDENTAKAASTARIWVICSFIVGEVLAQVTVSMLTRQVGTGIVIAGLVNIVVNVITYVIYLRALTKAKTMLKA